VEYEPKGVRNLVESRLGTNSTRFLQLVGPLVPGWIPGGRGMCELLNPNEIMQPVQEDIMALLQHHGLVGDDAARALMLCSAPIVHRCGFRNPDVVQP
jgi:hypothetical protein